MRNKLFDLSCILILVVIVGVIDIAVIPMIYPNQPLLSIIIFDSTVLVACGTLGVIFAFYENLRLFRMKDYSKDSTSHKYLVVLFVIIFILINTFIVWKTYKENGLMQSWIQSMTPLSAVLLSLRAAITEEIIFRLFIFTALIIIAKKLTKSESIALIFSTISSAILFSVLLHQGNIVSMLGGVLLAYVFYKKGITQAMIIHFISDLIPFIIVAILNIR